MRDTTTVPFTNVEYNRLLGSTYKHIEIIATGREIEVAPDTFKKEITLVAHRLQPDSPTIHYWAAVNDDEIRELAQDIPNYYVVNLERS